MFGICGACTCIMFTNIVKEVRVQTSGEVVKEQLQTVITDVTVPGSQKTLLKGSVEAKATTSNVPIVRTGQEGLQTLSTGTGTARTVDSSQTNNSATGAATGEYTAIFGSIVYYYSHIFCFMK